MGESITALLTTSIGTSVQSSAASFCSLYISTQTATWERHVYRFVSEIHVYSVHRVNVSCICTMAEYVLARCYVF